MGCQVFIGFFSAAVETDATDVEFGLTVLVMVVPPENISLLHLGVGI
jgi:hypothetical protein